jgi:competence protein ComEC
LRAPGAATLVVIACVATAAALALTHTDEVRDRASAGLGRGVPAREAALARGLVLGEDEAIDPVTVEEFRRAGLSHLLAVSGQNVALLALLAMPLLALLGMPLRTRLLWILGLIAFYVPLTGAGPSIQRAGVMGALSVLATLEGRRSSRLYALAFAALLTTAIDPGVAHRVGWQLSFAAVLGILALAAPLSSALRARLGRVGSLGRALVDGAAMTIAATLATAPLIAFHFGEVSVVTLLANVLALPAVAPAMWLGTLGAAAAQVPGVPVEALNRLAAIPLAYLAEVASWCAAPAWASHQVTLDGWGLAAAYAGIAAGVAAARRLPRLSIAAGAGLLAAIAAGVALHGSPTAPSGPPAEGLRVTVLDVGQGDAILFQPAAAPAILVDGGPPGQGLPQMLAAAGVGRLGAAIVTHDQSDHAGGIVEVLGEIPVESLLYASLSRSTRERAAAAGAVPRRIASGRSIRSGRLRLDIVWPPSVLLGPASSGADPNHLSLVAVARWRHFSMLLCGDAEAESVPLDPGPVDVLKVAHHGSEDAGLAALLERTRPRLAVVSVGQGNPHGHPAPATLSALAEGGVRVLRTDRDGSIVLEEEAGGLEAHLVRGSPRIGYR